MDILGIAHENIFIGLLSGGIVGLSGLIKNKISNWYVERKYPIKGNYITHFEDEEHGKIIVNTAPAILKQHGKRVLGETRLSGDERIWLIEGEITAGGHIHGVYYAKDPHDKGIGNFFLFINHKKYMEGIWSGYDSVNKKINSGKYTFIPVMKGIVLKKADVFDVPKILSISDNVLGKDYLDERISDYFKQEDKYIFNIAFDQSKNEIVGFCYTIIITPNELDIYLDISNKPKSLLVSNKIGIIKTVGVKNEYQGRGIGTQLIKDMMERLKNSGINSYFSIAWKGKERINIKNVLKSFKFYEYIEIPEYWRESSLKENYYCPECGNPPCKCSAVIFLKV